MFIQFKKYTNKPSILSCVRSDGSKTWAQLYPGIEAHDLAHYAVETTLGFKNAFYGLVAKGNNIEDFELPRDKRPEEVMPDNLPNEALVTEHLVNLIMTKAQTNDMHFDILTALNAILEEKNLNFPRNLTKERMNEMWTLFQNLLQQWHMLPRGETMELEF